VDPCAARKACASPWARARSSGNSASNSCRNELSPEGGGELPVLLLELAALDCLVLWQ